MESKWCTLWSGGLGESRPQAPTDPGVTVSRHRQGHFEITEGSSDVTIRSRSAGQVRRLTAAAVHAN
jgi:hypothetical protein